MAISPDGFVDVGNPASSRIPHTFRAASASETKASACAAEMLILVGDHKSGTTAMGSLAAGPETGQEGSKLPVSF